MSDDTCDMCGRTFDEGEHLNQVSNEDEYDAGDVCDACYKFLEDEGL